MANLTAGLDHVDRLDPGHGAVLLGLGADRTGTTATASIEARITAALSAYGEAYGRWAAVSKAWDYGGLIGLRYRW